ncbi:MAG: lipoprotein LprG [Pseudonocardiales bacterium]|jgi:lipoprotein LprG|uniref:LppX_LprAFG lipoprotein n=1 Tax=Pseudonocardia sp. Cha107L01 TaxID=3457576 RepID=UPI0028C70D3F|nr:lipoprotein LprG [Pseudonocardiales bacterium]MDT7645674.1 lipoprotein LprG [Pseudonocardiales bacterium]MDT7669147.1 lipoprotein LprG [Pseudonocardiales bacterium]MDT7753557.1 lipoprotein LprG [Pseudonocardiales bacterium]
MSLLAPLLALFALFLGVTGCSSGPTAPPLPAAPDLLAKSASAMAAVRTVAIDVQVDPALNTIPVRAANGKLTATGDAIGTATLNQGTSTVEFNFVITQGTLYLKGATGRYQRLPLALAAAIYDPTALLSPDRGISALLRSANNGTTEASEDVNGVPAYRVKAALDPNLVSSVVPGLSGASTGTVWIEQATSRLLKAQIEVPNPAGGAPAPVTVTLSDFNAPVTVTPPS